ncbi:hypothetical protein Bbelb_423240 [Branchiostoma belcheri]|nr:hypothetical protein Bbelb_423240 [Branchiostoma belcheri]
MATVLRLWGNERDCASNITIETMSTIPALIFPAQTALSCTQSSRHKHILAPGKRTEKSIDTSPCKGYRPGTSAHRRHRALLAICDPAVILKIGARRLRLTVHQMHGEGEMGAGEIGRHKREGAQMTFHICACSSVIKSSSRVPLPPTPARLPRSTFDYRYTKPTASVTTRRTCFCVLSTCKNVGKRTASVRGEYRLRTESYGFGSTQTRRRTLSACDTFSTCGLRIYHPCVRVRATRVPRTAYERATYGLLYKDDLTGDCQLVSKMPRKAQKKSTRQDPKKRAAEDTRAASDDEVIRRCTHLQRASTACTRQRGNRTEIVRCKHVQLTYHLRNVRCTQPLTAGRVVQTTYVHLASDVLPRPATLRLQKKRSRRSHDKNVRTKSTHGEL